MLNYFYTYSFVCVLILMTYSMGWSDLCMPLCFELKCFLFITVIINLMVGYVCRNKFNFRIRNFHFPIILTKYFSLWCFFVVLFALFEYYYCGQLPIVSVLKGNPRGYKEFTGIPTLHTILVTLSGFILQTSFIQFLISKKVKYIIWYILISFCVFIISFSRGGLCFVLMISFFLIFNYFYEKLKAKHYILGFIAIILFLYSFGALGNLRQGFSITNSHYIQTLGEFNDKYPFLMPKEFMWSYIYATEPMFNFNFNVYKENINFDYVMFHKCFIPDFLYKRIDSNSIEKTLLLRHYFNTTMGFTWAYVYGGIIGMFLMYGYLLLLGVIMAFIMPNNIMKFIALGIVNVLVILFFFTNTLIFSGFTFQVVYPMLFTFSCKKYNKLYNKRINSV